MIERALQGMRLSHFIAFLVGMSLGAWLISTDPRDITPTSAHMQAIAFGVILALLWECIRRLPRLLHGLLPGKRPEHRTTD
jgi:hypothetical protein